jgi:hypothetical protein
MNYVRLYTGPDGLSYFEDIEVPMEDRGSGTELSSLIPARGMILRRNSADYHLDFHTAPRKQFIVNLTGTVEIVASGGETRRFGPGSIMLAEDTTGKGHISKALTDERLSIFVTLED